jgi:hypothetical protein
MISISIGSLILHSQHPHPLRLRSHLHMLSDVVMLLDTMMLNQVLHHNLVVALVDRYTIVARQFDPCRKSIVRVSVVQ